MCSFKIVEASSDKPENMEQMQRGHSMAGWARRAPGASNGTVDHKHQERSKAGLGKVVTRPQWKARQANVQMVGATLIIPL